MVTSTNPKGSLLQIQKSQKRLQAFNSVQSTSLGRIRHARYPIVFDAKSLNPSYVMKGQASKSFIAADNIWVYDICFTGYQFHGEEGQKKQRNEEESQEDATTHAGPSEQSEQKQQEKGKEKESKEWAVPKPYAILYNDDKEERQLRSRHRIRMRSFRVCVPSWIKLKER